jgi:diguanylate cyclase (GGDEF)-like protein
MTTVDWLQVALLVVTGAAAVLLGLRLRASRESIGRLTELLEDRTAQLDHAAERLELLATTDGLTGIANRRRFGEFLQQEWNRALRSATPIALVMVDVDFFKRFNDSYGHLTGDDCLRRVASVLHAAARRPGDLAARYGGEEFAVVLGGTPGDSALIIADTLRRGIEELHITHESSEVSRYVTASVGVAMLTPYDGGTPELLIFAADEALYRAKSEGRNRTIAAWLQSPAAR